ncbi:hypothetical protein YC2023_075883 [Brassica napus]
MRKLQRRTSPGPIARPRETRGERGGAENKDKGKGALRRRLRGPPASEKRSVFKDGDFWFCEKTER